MARKQLGALLVGLLQAAGIGQATAQQEQVPAIDATLEAIVVTSQKRSEDLKEVPLSVSAPSGEALRDNQIADFADLSRSIPNVSFLSQACARSRSAASPRRRARPPSVSTSTTCP
ncbi:exported hypothetical protein [Burkholderiales bacterium]|nr:exported hypothetical protein [Burkholderiales bacterium]